MRICSSLSGLADRTRLQEKLLRLTEVDDFGFETDIKGGGNPIRCFLLLLAQSHGYA